MAAGRKRGAALAARGLRASRPLRSPHRRTSRAAEAAEKLQAAEAAEMLRVAAGAGMLRRALGAASPACRGPSARADPPPEGARWGAQAPPKLGAGRSGGLEAEASWSAVEASPPAAQRPTLRAAQRPGLRAAQSVRTARGLRLRAALRRRAAGDAPAPSAGDLPAGSGHQGRGRDRRGAARAHAGPLAARRRAWAARSGPGAAGRLRRAAAPRGGRAAREMAWVLRAAAAAR